MLLGCGDGTRNLHDATTNREPRNDAPQHARPKNEQPEGNVKVARDDREILNVVLRHLFEYRDKSLQGRRADLFFVGVGDRFSLSDPSPELLSNLTSSDRTVLPQSLSTFDLQEGVRHRSSGRLGLLFYARILCQDGDDLIVKGGYIEHRKSAITVRWLLPP